MGENRPVFEKEKQYGPIKVYMSCRKKKCPPLGSDSAEKKVENAFTGKSITS